jgi:hypothetical protein
MKISKVHHEERSEPDERGKLEWEYVYDVYTFSDLDVELRFRRYSDEATIATLMSPPSWSQLVGHQQLLGSAVRYLRGGEGIDLVHAYHPELGYPRPFDEAARSAASFGMISPEVAEQLIGCVQKSNDAV